MSSRDKEALDHMAGDWARDHDRFTAAIERAIARLDRHLQAEPNERQTGTGAAEARNILRAALAQPEPLEPEEE